MQVADALLSRKSVRAFTDEPVSKEQITQLLELARNAPSGTNTQPWQVAVLMGEKKTRLQNRILETAGSGQEHNMDYQYYPTEWVDPYLSRRKACGLLMYSTLGITREDKERKIQQWFANYKAFDAPIMLMFLIDSILEKGSYMDYGMFLQSIMVAAVGCGLATCPQAALAEYPDVVRDELGYDDSVTVLCGMAVGYEDKGAIINSYRTEREEVDSFTRFFVD